MPKSCSSYTKALFKIVLVAAFFVLSSTLQIGSQVLSQEFRLLLSRNSFPMPEIRGMTVREAEQRVLESGTDTAVSSAKAIIESRRLHWRPEGQVISQVPSAGERISYPTDDVGVEYGQASFSVTVSSGNLTPNFIGSLADIASDRAERYGLGLSFGSPVQSSTMGQGRVAIQYPLPNAPLSRDMQVKTQLSLGFPLPNFVGQHVELLFRSASELEFGVLMTRRDDRALPDIVVAQDPPAGTLLPLTGQVIVIVSNGAPLTPNFVGRTREDANQLANRNEITLAETGRADFDRPKGIVALQNPVAGDQLPDDRVVSVIISEGWSNTPNFVGHTQLVASRIAQISRIQLVDTRRMDFEKPQGIVINQNPEAESRLPKDRKVTVVISDGWANTPDFVDRTREEAILTAQENGIDLAQSSRLDFENSSGIVVSQSPLAGNKLPEDRNVSVTISDGWPVAPDATGSSFDEIRRLYPDIKVQNSSPEVSFAPAGEVLSQRPKAGVKLDQARMFYLETSAGQPLWLWLVAGTATTLVLGGAAIGINRFRASEPGQNSVGEVYDIELRVNHDSGHQIVQSDDNNLASDDDGLWVRVTTDVGAQSVDDEETDRS